MDTGVRVRRVVFITGMAWAQEGQTVETMLRRDDDGFDIVYEYTNRPGKRQLLLEPSAARAFEDSLQELGVFSWQSGIREVPEPQGVHWSLLIEGDGFEELVLQGATHAFPPRFPDFVELMDGAFKAAASLG